MRSWWRKWKLMWARALAASVGGTVLDRRDVVRVQESLDGLMLYVYQSGALNDDSPHILKRGTAKRIRRLAGDARSDLLDAAILNPDLE